jgi:hypothetical protein
MVTEEKALSDFEDMLEQFKTRKRDGDPPNMRANPLQAIIYGS